MIKILLERIRQGYRTIDFPKTVPNFPKHYRGLPQIDNTACAKNCNLCESVCPTKAVNCKNGKIKIDLGRCLFCPECEIACPEKKITFTKDHRLAVSKRENLIIGEKTLQLAEQLGENIRKTFGRSLKFRQVSAGGCNACEADINVLSTVGFDLGRFGIQIVASPRHADGIIVTGPVSDNMKLALEKTYRAVPEPKIVIAVGACAISGGPFINHEETHNGITDIFPVDLYIPGCPPHPLTILDGFLRLIGKIK
ncbi:MAG: hydrogenase [Verrucomicrobiae bacterium]|nr:hydrogenase [Verrucomicrobiae bacterium]